MSIFNTLISGGGDSAYFGTASAGTGATITFNCPFEPDTIAVIAGSSTGTPAANASLCGFRDTASGTTAGYYVTTRLTPGRQGISFTYNSSTQELTVTASGSQWTNPSETYLIAIKTNS